MKKSLVFRALAPIALSAVFCLALHAQDAITVTVPFNFSVGAHSLAAGDYRITQPVSGVLAIRSVAGKSTTLATTIPNGSGVSGAPPKLTFHRYGSSYFLRSVRSESHEWTMPKSPSERRLIATTPSYQSLGILASKGR